ncbi:Universal stress protein UspA-like protein [Frankia canadensis]|uniref:Universal stress protein UspA-like protein n=2 Tax=Frankia canadensis TaxID=1836972 RepID=A0A2I2KWZ5_9ACTN|nr:Universal stress protein UspA-like protein [Frankia canadensis]SOU57475.1 Universal stress protein UspA-like protein [Frankia canadensis]
MLVVEDYGPRWEPGMFELGTDGPRSIVAGVDGSRTSMRAAAFAAGLARRQSSRLVIVYVASPSVWAAVSPAPLGEAAAQIVDAVADEVRTLIQERYTELGIPVRFLIRTGDPLDGIRRTAAEVQADMVAVGASESAGHRLVGSLAGRLVRSGKWPVVVVP